MYADAGHALLSSVLHTVGIAVFEHAVAQVGRGGWRRGRRRWRWRRRWGRRWIRDQPCVHVGGALAAFQHDRSAATGRCIGVAVGRFAGAALVGRRELVALGGHEFHRVAARLQAVEEVVALCVRGLGGHDLAARIEQADGDAAQAALAFVLLAIAIRIHPHPVTQAGAAVQARVDARVGLAGFELHGGAAAVGADVAVGRIVAARIDRAERPAFGRADLHGVVAGRDVEAVVPAGIGRRGGHHGACGIQQLHADARHALLTGVLHAVGVAVFEHAVAQVGRGRWRRGRWRWRWRGRRRRRRRCGAVRRAWIWTFGRVLRHLTGRGAGRRQCVLLHRHHLEDPFHGQGRLQRVAFPCPGAWRIELQLVVPAHHGVGLAAVTDLDNAVLRGQDDVALLEHLPHLQLVHLAHQGLDDGTALDVHHRALGHTGGLVVLLQVMNRLGFGRQWQLGPDQLGGRLGQSRQLGLGAQLLDDRAALRRRSQLKRCVAALCADGRIAVDSHGPTFRVRGQDSRASPKDRRSSDRRPRRQLESPRPPQPVMSRPSPARQRCPATMSSEPRLNCAAHPTHRDSTQATSHPWTRCTHTIPLTASAPSRLACM